jgi:ABC-type transporter Mla maintaining outer membrane lipid asymmetry permease subunit MlaE
VFPRVLTLVLVVPVLTLLGDLIGSLGGLAIAVTYLDQPSIVYLQAMQLAGTPSVPAITSDLLTGG